VASPQNSLGVTLFLASKAATSFTTTARSVELAPYRNALGQIAEGFEASFIILDRDIFTIDVEEIDQTVVQQTWIQGETVYERP
jgi:predicted amidohydrolase YtcJ